MYYYDTSANISQEDILLVSCTMFACSKSQFRIILTNFCVMIEKHYLLRMSNTVSRYKP